MRAMYLLVSIVLVVVACGDDDRPTGGDDIPPVPVAGDMLTVELPGGATMDFVRRRGDGKTRDRSTR